MGTVVVVAMAMIDFVRLSMKIWIRIPDAIVSEGSRNSKNRKNAKTDGHKIAMLMLIIVAVIQHNRLTQE
jgi:uncharacterized membrane protein